MQDLDNFSITSLPVQDVILNQFLASTSVSLRLLFILNALYRVLKKQLVSITDFKDGTIEAKLEEIVICLFLQRPNMNSSVSQEETAMTSSLLRIEDFYNEHRDCNLVL